jgi:predicted enzyme related to lactoylglutathione lyase
MRQADTHHWVPCVRVADIESTVARARTVDVDVVTPVAETPGVARTAVLRDREGASVGLWEPRGVE